MILGYLRLLRLVFAISFNGSMNKALPGYATQAGELWRHSLITALACEAIVKTGTPVQVEPPVAFTTGLLHDIGKLALNDVLEATQLEAIQSAIAKDKLSCWQAEQMVLGTNHAEVGGCLLQKWKLPADIVEAVSRHHHPVYEPRPELSAVIQVADALAHTEDSGLAWDALAAGSMNGVLDALQLTPDKMAGLSAALKPSLTQVDHLMELG